MVRGLGGGSALVALGDGYRLQLPFYRVIPWGISISAISVLSRVGWRFLRSVQKYDPTLTTGG